MGRPKLTLPWGEATVIEQVVNAWQQGGVAHVVAVVRRDDEQLRELCVQAGARVVTPALPPAEMKDSVLRALEFIQERDAPSGDAAWLLAPADMPRLSAEVIQALLDAHGVDEGAILVPTHRPAVDAGAAREQQARRGHPVLFPWASAQDVARLGEDEGVNALVQGANVREIEVGHAAVPDDLDTMDDYRRLSSGEHGD